MENEDNKTENYLHLSVKISENSLGNFDKSKIKKKKNLTLKKKHLYY